MILDIDGDKEKNEKPLSKKNKGILKFDWKDFWICGEYNLISHLILIGLLKD